MSERCRSSRGGASDRVSRSYCQYDEDAARRLIEAVLEEDSTFAMAPERERLLITADLSNKLHDPVSGPTAGAALADYRLLRRVGLAWG